MPGPVGGGRHGGGGRSFGGGHAGGSHTPRSHSHGSAGFHRSAGVHRTGGYAPRHNPTGHRSTGGRMSGGCLLPVIVLIVFVLLAGKFFGRVSPSVPYADVSVYTSAVPVVSEYLTEEVIPFEDNTVSPNLVSRTKLDESLCKPVAVWYEDGAGLLTYASDGMQVEKALQYFYEKTGVQPYLMLLSDIDGNTNPDWSAVEQHLYDRYIELFGTDEGHYILLYYSYWDGSYDLFYIPGTDAVSVMDDNASDILLDYVELYYNTAGTYGEMFSEAFKAAANTVMGAVETQQTQQVTQQTEPPVVSEITTQNEEPTTVAPAEEPTVTQKTFTDMSVKEIAWVAFGGVAVVVLFVLVLRYRKKKTEELEKMT